MSNLKTFYLGIYDRFFAKANPDFFGHHSMEERYRFMALDEAEQRAYVLGLDREAVFAGEALDTLAGAKQTFCDLVALKRKSDPSKRKGLTDQTL